ncbi:hypothetical protein ACIA6E_30135 [Streptomyces sp. NPDC051815]|uniref:hypothetical protein n=1 Tax=Streptomyces sp. NPDC051815 TaxID=3365674 RepID=UPI0037905273
MCDNSDSARLNSASLLDLKVAASAAAQRGSVFYRTLGPQEESDWLDSVLDLIWSAVDGRDADEECLEALEELGEESQADEFDSSHPEFFAARSLELIGNALSVAVRPDPKRVDQSYITLRELLSIVDYRLGGSEPVITRYGDPPPPLGPLETREIEAENAVMEELSRSADRAATIGRIREKSSRFSSDLALPVSDCCSE